MQRQARRDPVHTLGLGNPRLTQRLLENLPKIWPSDQEESTTCVSQGCLLDKHPEKESRTKSVTRHVETKWSIAPEQNIVVNPPCSQFCI